MIRSYRELMRMHSFEDRFNYLRLDGLVGVETFGFDRYLNQKFYTSREWRHFRDSIIVRDNGCDLGDSDREIRGRITIHHINPISPDDVIKNNIEALLNPDNAICTSAETHKAIHYGDESLLVKAPIVRSKNDTCPWK